MLSQSSTKLIERAFENLDLSQEHGRVYLAMLRSGASPASKLAKEAGVPRSTCYDLIEDLIGQGLASKSKSETKAIFAPASPEHLEYLLTQKSQQFVHDLGQLTSTLPELSTVFHAQQSKFPNVQFFEGEKGLKTALYDSLSADEVLVVCQGSSEGQPGLDKDPWYLKDYFREFIGRKINSRELIEDTPAGREYFEKYNSEINQIKLIPKRTNDTFEHVDKYLYDDKIAYISHDNLTAVIIEDKTIAAHERILFEKLWTSS